MKADGRAHRRNKSTGKSEKRPKKKWTEEVIGENMRVCARISIGKDGEETCV